MVGTAQQYLPTLKTRFNFEKLDLLFIDHWKSEYLPDFKRFEESKLFKKGTVIVADNIVFPGAPDYANYVRSNKEKYSSVYIEATLEYNSKIIDGIEITTCLTD